MTSTEGLTATCAAAFGLPKATPICFYVSGHLKFSFRCGRAEFSNKAVTAQLEYICDLLTVLLEYIDLYYSLCSFLAGFH